MQEVIKFELKGTDATIHKPESNSTYFTYNNVHKIMLLGILGAIIGENGYNYNSLCNIIEKNDNSKVRKEDDKALPEFYTNLEQLKIAVKPKIENGCFVKKIQQFNNSVGYANINDSIPTTLIVSEQWLENPSWNIYILSDGSEGYLKIKDYLLSAKCEYIPYIGKNDHFADISNIESIQVENATNIEKIDSIFTDIDYESSDIFNSFEAFTLENMDSDKHSGKYTLKEMLPTKLNKDIGYTDFKEFIYTNQKIKINSNKNTEKIYKVNEENIYFF